MMFFRSIAVFIVAGLCEIGGGYLVWQWLRDGKKLWLGLVGGLILAAYGIVATIQTENFGRVYATYGGVFVVMSLLWGWKIDHVAPDRYDLIGAVIVLVGVIVMFYSPRNS